jgi:Tfp pilus assembly protein PilN
MPCLRWLGILTLLLIFGGAPISAQRPGRINSQQNDQAESDRDMQQRNRLQQQKQRFEEMQQDSKKLLELATQLKQYVDQSGEQVLSLDVVKKAEQIEKLARRVKDHMRGN